MQYDPIKRSLGKFFNSAPILRISFYKMLDLLFLRAWYVNNELRKLAAEKNGPINILDAGSGYGQYSYRMAKLFPKAQILGSKWKQNRLKIATTSFLSKVFPTVLCLAMPT